MGSSAIIFALVAVAVFLLGAWLGLRQGRAGAQAQLDQSLAGERNLASVRGTQIGTTFAEAFESIRVVRRLDAGDWMPSTGA